VAVKFESARPTTPARHFMKGPQVKAKRNPDMTSYALKSIPMEIWTKARHRALYANVSMRDVLIHAVKCWAAGEHVCTFPE